MSKTAVITARIEPRLKASVEQVFERLGLTTTQAITLFLRQVELQQGLPFTLKVPNADHRGGVAASPDAARLNCLC